MQVKLLFEREATESPSTVAPLKITMSKSDGLRSIVVEKGEETLLIEFLRGAIWTSFGFLTPPKGFW